MKRDHRALECASSSGCQPFLILSRGLARLPSWLRRLPLPTSCLMKSTGHVARGQHPQGPLVWRTAVSHVGHEEWKFYQLAFCEAAGKTICCGSHTSNCSIFRERHSFQGHASDKGAGHLCPRYSQRPSNHFHWFAWLRAHFLQVCGPPSKAFNERIYQMLAPPPAEGTWCILLSPPEGGQKPL